MKEVFLEENERIIGFKAILNVDNKSNFHDDFQFMICKMN